jgi:predicted ArsR family transcriptional regulator
MKRNQFLSSACTLGLCSCAGLSTVSSNTLLAGDDDSKKKATDWRIGFMQKRFAGLIQVLDSNVDEQTRIKILESIGRTCAKENAEALKKYKDNPEAYLKDIKEKWAENTEFDPQEKKIRVIGKKEPACFCPFVDKALTPKHFCQCSLGNMKETFETILGTPVEATIEESILYGGERCTFAIRYK